MIGGVYHPRARGGAMSDALADAKPRAGPAVAHRWPCAARGCRCSLAALAALLALVELFRRRCQPQQRQSARRRQSGWARWARSPPISCSRPSASPRWRSSRRLLVWGARALSRQVAQICHVAAGGLAAGHRDGRGRAWACCPSPTRLPAGAGGLIGIAAGGLSRPCAQVWHAPALAWALPLVLLLVGLPLAFLATGLRFMPDPARDHEHPCRRCLAGRPDQKCRTSPHADRRMRRRGRRRPRI